MAATELTAGLGRFIAALSFEDVPEPALQLARSAFIDTIGVLIAGAAEPATTRLLDVLQPGPGRSRLLFGPRRADAPDAAWINGTAAHALDFDDAAARSHPSAVLVPAILAEAEVLGASGRDMLTAYVAGYEALAEIALRDRHQPVARGWHPTGIFGPVAAAAACARLRQLSAEQSAHALALAASQSAGLVANFGTMTKPFHAGRAAHAGVMSARLAAAGFTAATDALEHRQGLLAAISPQGQIDLETPLLAGLDWHLPRHGLNVKRYPMCYCAHRHVDAMLELTAAHGLLAADVQSVRVAISRRNHGVLKHHAPTTGLQAKFSVEFAMASALIAREVSFAQLTDEFVQQPDVRALMARVQIDVHDDEDPLSGHAPFDWVVVHSTRHGELQSRRVAHAKGAFRQPLQLHELKAKFMDCLRHAGRDDAEATALFDRLRALDTLPTAAALYAPAHTRTMP
jgi:2-methylcitrate dehydratase PrpD